MALSIEVLQKSIKTYAIDRGYLRFLLKSFHPETQSFTGDPNLEINASAEHYDPSDHIIISQAITLGVPLISGDQKFPFYTNQGLDLIYNR